MALRGHEGHNFSSPLQAFAPPRDLTPSTTLYLNHPNSLTRRQIHRRFRNAVKKDLLRKFYLQKRFSTCQKIGSLEQVVAQASTLKQKIDQGAAEC